MLLATSAAAVRAQLPIPRVGAPGQGPGQGQPGDSLRGRPDTIKVPPFRFPPPVSPLAATGRSILLPGWGQAVLGRRLSGALFVFWEGLTLTMTVKASNQLGYIRAIGDTTRESAKKQEIQDWVTLLAFNHLLSGVDAFVSAQLWDFPAEFGMRALPGGAVGLGLQVGLRRHRGGRRRARV